MSFYHFTQPVPEDFCTYAEYQEALRAWERAEDDYADNYMERQY